MKNIICLILFLLVFKTNYSQNNGVETSLFNFQTGILGTWINNEMQLSKNFVLRSEIGLDAGAFGGDINETELFTEVAVNGTVVIVPNPPR